MARRMVHSIAYSRGIADQCQILIVIGRATDLRMRLLHRVDAEASTLARPIRLLTQANRTLTGIMDDHITTEGGRAGRRC